MNMKKVLQICMVLAFTGCAVTLIGDVLMLGAPLSGREYFAIYKRTMIHTSADNLFIGNTLGLFVVLELFGYWALYLMLRASHKPLALAVFYSLSISMLAGLAYHSCFAFYGMGLQVHSRIGSAVTARMIEYFEHFHSVFYYLLGSFFGIGSLAFVILLLWKITPFKKWQALLNPLFILIAVRSLLAVIPAPAGGYIAPGYGNITNIIFFAFITIVLIQKRWNIPGEK